VTGRERIACALDRGQPDAVPLFEASIDEPIVLRLAELLSIPGRDAIRPPDERTEDDRIRIRELYVAIVRALDLDSTSTGPSAGLRRVDPRHAQDKFGTVWALSAHGDPLPVAGPIQAAEDLDRFDMVSRLDPRDFEGVRHVIQAAGNARAHFVGITDPFKVSWSLRGGMEHHLLDYALDPILVHALMRTATAYAKAAIDMATDAGADAILLAGDFGGEQSLLMSPKHFREYVKPYHREIVAHAHGRGRKIVKHTDGQVWPILDDFLEVGFDGFHPVQPQCMDIGEVKRYLSGCMCVVGNIDCRNLLPFGSEEDVTQSVRDTIRKAAPGGGYILSSSNTIHPGCKAENYLAMVRAAQRYGRHA